MGMRRVEQARIIFWAVEITLEYSKIAGRNFSWMSQMLYGRGFRGGDWDGGVEGRTRERDSLVWGVVVSLGVRRQILGGTHGIFEVAPLWYPVIKLDWLDISMCLYGVLHGRKWYCRIQISPLLHLPAVVRSTIKKYFV